jgi:hypothetical protein
MHTVGWGKILCIIAVMRYDGNVYIIHQNNTKNYELNFKKFIKCCLDRILGCEPLQLPSILTHNLGHSFATNPNASLLKNSTHVHNISQRHSGLSISSQPLLIQNLQCYGTDMFAIAKDLFGFVMQLLLDFGYCLSRLVSFSS